MMEIMDTTTIIKLGLVLTSTLVFYLALRVLGIIGMSVVGMGIMYYRYKLSGWNFKFFGGYTIGVVLKQYYKLISYLK